MRVMVFVKATKDSEAGSLPGIELMEAMGKYNDELVAAGILTDGECGGLKGSFFGKRIRFDGDTRTVKDGPFSGDANDIVCGYWIWEVKDMDEAVAWAKKCPNPMLGPSELEIRPYFADEDFAELFTQTA